MIYRGLYSEYQLCILLRWRYCEKLDVSRNEQCSVIRFRWAKDLVQMPFSLGCAQCILLVFFIRHLWLLPCYAQFTPQCN